MLNTPLPLTFEGDELLTISYFETMVPAGLPAAVLDTVESKIDLNELLIKHPASTFMIKVEGESMLYSFIPPKALLLVDRLVPAVSGSIIVATLNGEFTVKKLVRNSNSIYLMPSNPDFQPMHVTSDMIFQIWGVVTKIIIDPKDVAHLWLG